VIEFRRRWRADMLIKGQCPVFGRLGDVSKGSPAVLNGTGGCNEPAVQEG